MKILFASYHYYNQFFTFSQQRTTGRFFVWQAEPGSDNLKQVAIIGIQQK